MNDGGLFLLASASSGTYYVSTYLAQLPDVHVARFLLLDDLRTSTFFVLRGHFNVREQGVVDTGTRSLHVEIF